MLNKYILIDYYTSFIGVYKNMQELKTAFYNYVRVLNNNNIKWSYKKYNNSKVIVLYKEKD